MLSTSFQHASSIFILILSFYLGIGLPSGDITYHSHYLPRMSQSRRNILIEFVKEQNEFSFQAV